jgi:hypothetical protein
MVAWTAVEKSGGTVGERKKTAQHSAEMQKKTWQLTRGGNRGRRDTTNKVGGEGQMRVNREAFWLPWRGTVRQHPGAV